MNRWSLILLVFLIIVTSTYAIVPIKEHIVIRNYSSKTLIMTREYSDDPTKRFYAPEIRAWRQNVCGINLDFTDIYLESVEIRINPNQYLLILEYYPMGNLDGYEAFTHLEQIPFMDKMRSIYKSLRIVNEDGKIDINLDNLVSQIIKKYNEPGGGRTYYLDIFDNDLER